MKKIIFCLIILLVFATPTFADYAGVVVNTSTRDTLGFPCNPVDSFGADVNLASGDSIYVMVWYPGGALAFRDSMAWNDASIDREGWEDFADSQYHYVERVSVLDGGSPVKGIYKWTVIVDDLTSSALPFTYRGYFQVVTSTLESSLDSAGLALLAANKAIDSLADVLDSLETISTWAQDSIYALLDTIQLWDTRIDSIEAALADASISDKAWVDGTPANRGEINDILDTLQNQDDWGASAAELAKVIDSLADVLDSLETISTWLQDSVYAILDSIQDVMGVDAIQISGDATAANNLETMLDGTGGQTFSLGRLVVDHNGSTPGFYVKNAGSGAATYFENSGTGNAFNVAATAGSGHALYAYSTGGYGFNIVAGGARGISLSGTTHDFYLGGSGVISNGTNTVLMTDDYALMGVVEDSSGNSTTRIQTNLAEATDDHYNGMAVFFIDGDEAVTARRITDYNGTNGYLVYDPATTATPGTGDSIRIIPWASVSASATISDADMGAIGDTVWQKDTTGLLDAGTYGLEATTGGAANITDADMSALMDSASNRGFVHYDSATAILQLRSLHIRGTTGNDTALIAHGYGGGIGGSFYGGATGTGFKAEGQGGGSGAYFQGGASNAMGLKLEAGGTGKDLLLLTSGTISDGTNNVVMDHQLWRNVDSAHVDSSEVGEWLKNNLGNAIGTGIDTVDYYAVDTSGTNDSVNGVVIWTKTWSGNDYTGALFTNTKGYITLVAQTNDTLRVYSYKLGYAWESDTLIFAAQGSDSAMGYDVTVGTAGGDSTLTCYGYAVDGSGNPVRGVLPKAELQGTNVVDTCNDVTIVDYNVTGTRSNTTGYWEIELKKSKCLNNYNEWKIFLKYGSSTDYIFQDTIPGDSATWRVTRY